MTSLVPATFRPFRLALIQLATTADKQINLHRARSLVKEACSNGANVVVLPVRAIESISTNHYYRSALTAQYSNFIFGLIQFSMALSFLPNMPRQLIHLKKASRKCVRSLRYLHRSNEFSSARRIQRT